jgi:16S rRNA (adenine1518-N6/adenine1519-N6)-dimethyltransferase
MTLYQKAKHLMHTYKIFPKKRLGQNFMADEHFLSLLLSYAALESSDVVLEVGAGFGFLTHFLAQKSKTVVAVEADTHLVQILQSELAGLNNVELIEGDIFEVHLPVFNKVVSNPPFSISSPLLFWLFSKTFDFAVLTFQKEFARRLDVEIGCKDYSRLTVSTYYHAEVELLDDVPKEAFYPRPDVDAAIVRLKPRNSPPFHVKDEKVFEEVVRTLFTQRNRKVRKAILSLLHRYGLKKCMSLQKTRFF